MNVSLLVPTKVPNGARKTFTCNSNACFLSHADGFAPDVSRYVCNFYISRTVTTAETTDSLLQS